MTKKTQRAKARAERKPPIGHELTPPGRQRDPLRA